MDIYLQVSQVTALPSGSCALVWDSETEERTNHMSGQLQDPVGTIGRGTSISPELRRWLEAGTILSHSPHK